MTLALGAAMRRRLGRFGALTAVALFLCAGPAAAQPNGAAVAALSFDDAAAITLAPGDDPQPVLVLNATTTLHHVFISLQATTSSPARTPTLAVSATLDTRTIGTTPVAAEVPVSGSLTVFVKPTGTKGDAYLVVSDVQDDLTIRRALHVATAATGKPAVTSWKRTVSDTGSDGRIGTIPLAAGQSCGTPAESSAVVVSGDDDQLTVTGTCTAGLVTLRAKGIDGAPVGVYSGSLKIGDADTSLELTVRAPWWQAVIALAIGIVLALLLRSIAGRRALWSLRRRIRELPDPTHPPDTKWHKRAGAEVATTRTELATRCADTQVYPSWQRGAVRWLRCLFVPTPAAAKLTADVETERADAEAKIAAWDAGAAAKLDALGALTVPAGTPMSKLAARAADIAGDPGKGMLAPSDSAQTPAAQRAGVDGLAAVLDEAEAILTVAETARRVTVMLQQLAGATPPASSDDPALAAAVLRAWRQNYADAELRLTGAEQEIARTVDARALLTDGFEDRVHDATLIFDRLAVVPPVDAHTRTLAASQSGGVTAMWWQSIPARLKEVAADAGRLVAGRAVLISDLLAVGVATLVVLVAGLTSLYVGRDWGSGLDWFTAIIAAAGGTLTIAPLVAALDRLGAGTDPAAPSGGDA
jgi:hypothetical protein